MAVAVKVRIAFVDRLVADAPSTGAALHFADGDGDGLAVGHGAVADDHVEGVAARSLASVGVQVNTPVLAVIVCPGRRAASG